MWSPVLHFDLDAADDLDAALADAGRLTTVLLQRYPQFGEDDLEIFYSGGRASTSGCR